MWQEIIVGLIIVAALLFIGIRFWKSMKAAKGSDVCCACGCSDCGEATTSGEQCRRERS
jgi:hypothetical protein